MLLRFAMILQSQAPSTLNKYICKLAEAVLLENPRGITLFQLNQTINEQFNLAFTEEEVKAAIEKKGKKRITISNELYFLIPSIRQTLYSQQSLAEELDSVIGRFVEATSQNVSVKGVSSLLKNICIIASIQMLITCCRCLKGRLHMFPTHLKRVPMN